MVTKYGMSDRLGAVVLDTGNDEVFIGRSMGHTKMYSEATVAGVDEEIRAIIDQAMEDCTRRLQEHRTELGKVAEYLLEYETMDAEEFEKVFA